MSFVDFSELKEKVSITDVVSLLSLTLTQAGKQLRGCCPIHNGDNPREFVITPEKNLFYCFHCEKGGDQLALYAAVKNISVGDAAKELTKSDSRPAKQDGLEPLDYLQHDHPAVWTLGFEADVAEKLGIGFATKGLMRGTVAVPIRLPDGSLAGYIGITEDIRLPKSFKV